MDNFGIFENMRVAEEIYGGAGRICLCIYNCNIHYFMKPSFIL